jgi:predicted nucleotidyltransferase
MVIKMIKKESGNIELEKAIHTINENLNTDKIYLFGSFGQGNPNEESDLDLCIITSNLRGRKIEALRKIRHALAPKVSLPVDLLLYTSHEFSERAKLSSTFEYKILNEGILVYGS